MIQNPIYIEIKKNWKKMIIAQKIRIKEKIRNQVRSYE